MARPKSMDPKNKVLQVRVSEDTLSLLKFFAQSAGLSVADMLNANINTFIRSFLPTKQAAAEVVKKYDFIADSVVSFLERDKKTIDTIIGNILSISDEEEAIKEYRATSPNYEYTPSFDNMLPAGAPSVRPARKHYWTWEDLQAFPAVLPLAEKIRGEYERLGYSPTLREQRVAPDQQELLARLKRL